MTVPARRPWWKMKRWAAALLLVAYPASAGPALYCTSRGWLPHDAVRGYVPALYVIEFPGNAYRDYLLWWSDLGFQHAD